MNVYVDTSAFLAVIDADDAQHRQAALIWKALIENDETLVCSNYVLIETLADPDQVRRSRRFANARLLSRWFEALRGGKYVVVVVVSDISPQRRHWIITAYISRRLAEGDIEWARS